MVSGTSPIDQGGAPAPPLRSRQRRLPRHHAGALLLV